MTGASPATPLAQPVATLPVRTAPELHVIEAAAERPRSAVSIMTGFLGSIVLALLTWAAVRYEITGATAMFFLLGGTAAAMVLWSVLVERVYLHPSTGLDFSIVRAGAELRSLVYVKTVGFAATLAVLFIGYLVLRTYTASIYADYFWYLTIAAPVLLLVSPLYIAFTSRHMSEPKDGLWHFGQIALMKPAEADRAKVADHLRSWGVKFFFLAFMFSVVPNNVDMILKSDFARLVTDPLQALLFLVRVSFLYDAVFGTIGYIVTTRLLDTHIRSANPYLSGWTAALICYPPFVLMATGGPLDYRAGSLEWLDWFGGYNSLLVFWGILILVLSTIYASATVIFGLRFSNLTNRGIITNGPYRYFKHPAYVSKNVMWWCIHLPFLSTVGWQEGLRNCALLLVVNFVYYLRAKTEEKHLMADPDYQAYSAWIARHGVLERCWRRIRAVFAGGLRRDFGY